jgi:3-dehydroquinate synthase
MSQQIIKCRNLTDDLRKALQTIDYNRLFILADENTNRLCMPLLAGLPELNDAPLIIIKAGDINKNIETLSIVWKFLSDNGATRKSLLLNLGGGMLTDLGGFAAATFKRGIRFINIPTTLLAVVDAAVGGKTGINFNGLKNEIGTFSPAEIVLIESEFFKTLDKENFLSGYAEMIKHALLESEKEWQKIMSFNVDDVDYGTLKDLMVTSVGIKEKIVEQDPTEKGIRKALNLGHTIGHAFESLSYEINCPVLHGYAIAWGLVCELYLSFKKTGFEQNKLTKTIRFIKENYGIFRFDCKQYDRLYELMQHDKKNESAEVNFTLLSDIGNIKINQTASKEEIFDALDFYHEYFG